jgi:hypothetical protein
VNDQPRRLTAEQVLALKFAAHRQLARWAGKPLQPRRRVQRAALVRAVRVLEDRSFAHGCELHPPDREQRCGAGSYDQFPMVPWAGPAVAWPAWIRLH